MVRMNDDPRFSVAVSRERDGGDAMRGLTASIKAQLREAPDLAFLFVTSHHADDMEKLSAAIREELAVPVLLGCTGEGVIAGLEEIETGPGATLWAATLPGTVVTPVRLGVPPEWPEDPAEDPSLDPALPVFLMLAEPFSTPMDEVLGALADRHPGALAIGGMAGGGRDVGENRLLLNEEVYERGVVAVAVSGAVSIRTVVSQGCRPIGERYVITKAENNVIHELGGASALQRLEDMFKSLSEDERQMAHRALHIGLVINEHRNSFERGDFLVRNLIGADRSTGSLAVGDVVEEGQTVQFHVRDAAAASEDLRLLMASDRTKHTRPQGALLFSCCGRGRAMFGTPNHDITTVLNLAGSIPVAGFFAQGEIGPVGGSNFLHGYTASIALFSKRSDSARKL